MSRNAICVWDFTSFDVKSKNDHKRFVDGLNNKCKEWSFQIEETGEGKLHIQGRFCLSVKTRKPSNLFGWKAHYSPSSTGGVGNYDYVTKERTRVAGPFNHNQYKPPTYVPRQYRHTELRPFQVAVIAMCLVFDDRKINLIYCPFGNKGKSVLAHTMRLKHGAIVLPPLNDGQQIVAAACDICIARKVHQMGGIFIDLPRAMNKDRLFGVYTEIEQVKQGWLYDVRYKWKEWDIDSPPVWVFSNHLPDNKLLSNDRWKVWTINDSYELVEYKDELDFVKDP